MCQWSLLKGGLNANTGMWLSGLQCHSSPADSERRSKPLGIWMAAAPILFKNKWPQLVEAVLIMALAKCMFSGRTEVLLLTPGCIAHWFQRFAMAGVSLQSSTTAVPTLLKSSSDRNWPPRWFKEIIPKIITFHFLYWRDRPHYEEASVGHIQDVPMSCSELAVCTELLSVLKW